MSSSPTARSLLLPSLRLLRPPCERRLPFNASGFDHPSSTFGSVCMQSGGNVGAERCLFLNVFQPAGPAAAGDTKLPIMFWIHGGAMKSGAGSEYNGTTLASAHNVLVVTINCALPPPPAPAAAAAEGFAAQTGLGSLGSGARRRWSVATA